MSKNFKAAEYNMPDFSQDEWGPMPPSEPYMFMEEMAPPPPPEPGIIEHDDQAFQPSQPVGFAQPTRTPPRKKNRLVDAPGTRMMNYLFARSQLPKLQTPEESLRMPQGFPVLTQNVEALKTALSILGIRSDKNTLGLDLSIDEARKIVHGGKKMGEIDDIEFRNKMESGDKDIDKKRIKQQLNPDGSVTVVILNEDKSVMGQYTIGNYQDQKVFTMGDYSAYADQLRMINARRAGGFEQIRRRMYGG